MKNHISVKNNVLKNVVNLYHNIKLNPQIYAKKLDNTQIYLDILLSTGVALLNVKAKKK